MTKPDVHLPPPEAAKLAAPAQWVLLIAVSAVFSAVLAWADMPAALLLGPMLGGIAVAFFGARIQVPRQAFAAAQGVLGCMIATALPISSWTAGDWPLLAAGVLTVIAACGALGWLMTRLRVLPGTTVVWGLSPGAASVMILMADSFGADAQIVALMQYTRVILVAGIASAIAKFTGAAALHAAHAVEWFPAIAWLPFAQTLALAAAGPFVARRLNMPSAALLVPVIFGMLLTAHGVMTIELPHWLLAAAYAFIGWRIGLRFTRPLLVYALGALPAIIVSTLALIAACGALAAVFVLAAGVDPLTAYLATSPGGADSVAIISASTHVDAPFVMTMQMMRFGVVMLIGPAMAKFIAVRIGAPRPAAGT
ncbi:AbrB family transcriptional regulator [Pigmentiphaga soli]|uniref:AbrB family transcriptional regulator n=1 Tax=Pigmentiphaga soli TaxID=1007095 RepID=A0ABP8GDU8_9BURK